MQVVVGDTVVAEAAENHLMRLEGNFYFPPDAVEWSLFEDSPTPYTCPWKGRAQYWHVRTSADIHPDAAWAYPQPLSSAIDRVGRDFSGYVAFDRAQVRFVAGQHEI